jgi:hypothetical protein
MSFKTLESEININEENDINESNNNDTVLELQLGDVIQIFNPVNEKIHNQIFIIDYIDKSKTYLINTDTLEKIKLKITEEGVIGDGNINKIAILSRSDSPSYARQNDLLPGKWINIYFGGELPIIFTGEITNLEQDMIEVRTVDGDTLYINFDYKGLPEDLPIDNIELREKPYRKEIPQPQVEEGPMNELQENDDLEEGEIFEGETIEPGIPVMATEKFDYTIPIKNIKDQLREFVIRADQIKFGNEELGPVVQFVDVKGNAQRFSIESQVADLLDELLSTIPNNLRTPRVLDNIHIIIERFKQLREHFSFVDKYGNIEGAVLHSASFKPLSTYFYTFKQNLYWILPVVKNIKKVYDIENIYDENTDLDNINLNANLKRINEFVESYKSNTLPSEQNNYASLYSELNPYFTPFNLIGDENKEGILIEKDIRTNINVIIDNLEDMYSSIFSNNNIRTKKFVIEKYNLGLTKLNTIDSTSSRLVTVRTNMTPNDVLSIKTFVTLPEPAIKFSAVNLPGSSLLNKANLNLHFLNYWELLKKKTHVNYIEINNLNDEIEFEESIFANSIISYIFNLNKDDIKNLKSEEIYKKIINIIIPKIKVIFNLMKKYIVGKLSIMDIIGYLEPFLIYTDQLTYQQYTEITNFINQQISTYNKTYKEKERTFAILKVRSAKPIFENAYSVINILSKKNNLRGDITDAYNIYDVEKDNTTNSEIIRTLLLKDYSKLYTTALSLQNLPLMFPSEFSVLFDEEKQNTEEKMKKEAENNTCKTMVLSKYYKSLDALNADNDKVIYFDKKYDSTNYGVLDSYEKEIIKLTPEDLLLHITRDLMNKNKISESDADYLANTLLDGHKKVKDGQYAILYKGYKEKANEEIDYYVRRNNNWELDNEMSNVINTDETNILCNLQEKCISVPNNNNTDDKCESIQENELGIQNKLLKDVINEFDTRYKVSKDQFEKETKEKFDYFIEKIGVLSKIDTNSMLKYNKQKYNIGANIEDNPNIKPISPYTKLLNLILNQSDFVKKQQDIIRFVNTYTRLSMEGYGPLNEKESHRWLYCLKTNMPLLPQFKFELAVVFVNDQPNYINHLEMIKSRFGKLSDDGDWWTDEHSGWPICPVDFDIEEGYENGFKISSRSVEEEDSGNKIGLVQKDNQILYTTPESRVVLNIIKAIETAMGINIADQKSFIIDCVLVSLRDNLQLESDYKEEVKRMAEKGKKIPSYNEIYNTYILYYTLGMILIAIQTAIPSVKTRKTHPGCIRSFDGYPFEGTGDLSSLTYISCVAYDIRKSGEPWNVLKKREIIPIKLKKVIDDVLINLENVREKFLEKTDYLLTNPITDIPREHDIAKWSQFLPPLVAFKIKHLANISEEFKKSLIHDLRNGIPKQNEKILVIASKIIFFSLAVQEAIDEIVKKNKLILQNANNEPYIENACCETGTNETTIMYFMKKNARIDEYNKIVNRLTLMLDDIISYSKSGLFLSKINTKNVYPPVSNEFNEKTIYLSFIHFCKFKTFAPIPTDLLPICTGKPEYTLINPNDSIDRMIQKLKDDGRNYTNEQFLRLLQLISRNNTVNINFDKTEVSSKTRLLELIESIDDENDEVVEPSLRELIKTALDTFEIESEGYTKEVKDLNNFLTRGIETMREELIEFIEKNAGTGVNKNSIKKTKQIINSFSSWSADDSERNKDIKISNDKMYNINQFYTTFIENFASIFPTIILNQVDHNNLLIPNYLGFSSNHEKKLKTAYKNYYDKLHIFYGTPTLLNILTTIQQTTKNLVYLSKETPSFSDIKIGEIILKPVFDERTSRFLYEYYLLRVFINYIELTDYDDMIVHEVKEKEEITDIFSVDYLEETNTRADLTFSTRDEGETLLLTGNKKLLRQKITQLLISFIDIMNKHKDTIDISYEDIQDRAFKLKEKEKNLVTDRLKKLTDEERDADTILKINKLNQYSKGLQKGLTVLDKDFYDEEQQFRDELNMAEKIIRKKNKGINDDEIENLVEDYMEEQEVNREIDNEVYDMEFMNEDFFNGNTDGVGAPEEEYDDYNDFD